MPDAFDPRPRPWPGRIERTLTDGSWSLWLAERSNGLLLDWPSSLWDEMITTPLPRPEADYAAVGCLGRLTYRDRG